MVHLKRKKRRRLMPKGRGGLPVVRPHFSPAVLLAQSSGGIRSGVIWLLKGSFLSDLGDTEQLPLNVHTRAPVWQLLSRSPVMTTQAGRIQHQTQSTSSTLTKSKYPENRAHSTAFLGPSYAAFILKPGFLAASPTLSSHFSNRARFRKSSTFLQSRLSHLQLHLYTRAVTGGFHCRLERSFSSGLEYALSSFTLFGAFHSLEPKQDWHRYG